MYCLDYFVTSLLNKGSHRPRPGNMFRVDKSDIP